MKLATLSLIGILVIAGCSNSVTPPVVDNTHVTYVKAQSYGYYSVVLDKTTGQPTGVTDTITSTIIDTSGPYNGRSNVTTIRNFHTHPNSGVAFDTTYIAQNNGNYYHYNYGIEALNNDPAVTTIANSGQPIEAGWVLQAKLSAAPGDTWTGVRDTLSLNSAFGPTTVYLTDSATEVSDTTIMVHNQPEVTKHSVHHISLVQPGGLHATEVVDTYVSVADGTVLDTDHPTSLNGSATPGLQTIFFGKES